MISEVHEYNLSHHVHYIECLRRRRRRRHPQSRRLSSSLIKVPPILVSLFVVVVVVVCIHYYYINETQMRGQKKGKKQYLKFCATRCSGQISLTFMDSHLHFTAF